MNLQGLLEKKRTEVKKEVQRQIEPFPEYPVIQDTNDKDILFTLNRIVKFSKEEDELG